MNLNWIELVKHWRKWNEENAGRERMGKSIKKKFTFAFLTRLLNFAILNVPFLAMAIGTRRIFRVRFAFIYFIGAFVVPFASKIFLFLCNFFKMSQIFAWDCGLFSIETLRMGCIRHRNGSVAKCVLRVLIFRFFCWHTLSYS